MNELVTHDHTALREQVLRIKSQNAWSYAALGQQVGIPGGTISSYLGNTYNGDCEKIADKITKWLRSRDEEAKIKSLSVESPSFVKTPTALRMISALTYAQAMSDIVVCASTPGIGKSTVIDEYQRNNPNVWTLSVEPYMKSMTALLQGICEALDIPPGYNGRVTAPIRDKIRDRGGVLVCDESQYLTGDHLNQLRAFNEKYKVGIALFGNPNIHARIEGRSRDVAYAQFYSRLGMRLHITKPAPGDIEAILDAWQIEDADARKMLHSIGEKPGALRSIDKTLKLASMAANGGDGVLSRERIFNAYAQLSKAIN